MNRIKQISAAVLAVAMMLTFVACRTKDETVLSFAIKDGKGTYDMKASTYLCLLIDADNDFRSQVQQNLSSDSGSSANAAVTTTSASDIDYAKQTVKNADGKEVNQDKYVKDAAMKLAKSFAYTELEFERLGLKLSKDYTDYISQQCDKSWNENGYKELYEPNGVSYSTYEDYSGNTYKKYMIYNYYYGKADSTLETMDTVANDFAKNKASKRPSDQKIQQAILDNYVLVDQIVVQYSTTDSQTQQTTELTDAQKKDAKAKLEGYAKRINNGEKFKAIYNEYNNTADTTDNTTSTDSSKPKDALATVLTSAEASQSGTATDYFDEAKKLDFGKAKVLEKDGTSCALIIHQNILGDAYYITQYSEAAVEVLCFEDFADECEKLGGELTLDSNSSAINFYSPKKITYPESAQ